MYHIYFYKNSVKQEMFGKFDTKNEVNQLVKYWNFMYPNRTIKEN